MSLWLEDDMEDILTRKVYELFNDLGDLSEDDIIDEIIKSSDYDLALKEIEKMMEEYSRRLLIKWKKRELRGTKRRK